LDGHELPITHAIKEKVASGTAPVAYSNGRPRKGSARRVPRAAVRFAGRGGGRAGSSSGRWGGKTRDQGKEYIHNQ